MLVKIGFLRGAHVGTCMQRVSFSLRCFQDEPNTYPTFVHVFLNHKPASQQAGLHYGRDSIPVCSSVETFLLIMLIHSSAGNTAWRVIRIHIRIELRSACFAHCELILGN